MTKKILETERLYLRAFAPDDAETIFRLNSDARVMEYMPDCVRAKVSLEASIAFVRDCMSYAIRRPGLGLWPTVRKDDDAFMGWTCLKHLDDTDEIEIGYRYFPSFWGQGYCTEAASALVAYGFRDLRLARIVGISHPENRASRRVLEKLGMTHHGESRHYGIDVAYYVIKRDDFNARPKWRNALDPKRI